MTDLELETLKQMRELCAEQMERAPTSCEYVDWRNKSWIIEGILDDEKERRELTTVHSEENETENVTENKTESEDIEMSTSEVNGLEFSPIGIKAKPILKEMFRKLHHYRSHCIGASRFGVIVKGKTGTFDEVIFFASDGKTAYFTGSLFYPTGCLEQGVWYYDDNCVDDVYDLLKKTNKNDMAEIAYAGRKIVFKLADHTATIEADDRTGAEIFGKLVSYRKNGIVRSTVDLKNVSEIVDAYQNTNRYNDEMKITADDTSFSIGGRKLTIGGIQWKHPMKYYYSSKLEQLFRKNSSVTFSLYELDGAFYFVIRQIGKDEFFIQMLDQQDHKMLTDIYINGKTTVSKQIPEPKQETKPEPKPEHEKEETEMTATEIKPAQETGNFTFSVSTSPTDFECIGLDYKPGIDLTKPTDVECKRPDLGEFIQGNKTYELYRNDELKRYRLTFKRHLTKDERDYLWTNKWTWRKDYKCYQWGYTKNGDEAARLAIEYFEKR